MEFYKEDAFIAGVPLRYTPACILSSLRDLRLGGRVGGG